MRQPETKYHKMAEQQGIPLRTLADVTADLEHAKGLEKGTDMAMARIMARHGRLTDEARSYVEKYLDK